MLEYGVLSAGFRFAWSDDSNCCGYCRADDREKVVALCKPTIKLIGKKKLNEIVLHEIAHALDYVRHGGWRSKERALQNGKTQTRNLVHDKIWKDIAREIGLKNPKSTIEIP